MMPIILVCCRSMIACSSALNGLPFVTCFMLVFIMPSICEKTESMSLPALDNSSSFSTDLFVGGAAWVEMEKVRAAARSRVGRIFINAILPRPADLSKLFRQPHRTNLPLHNRLVLGRCLHGRAIGDKMFQTTSKLFRHECDRLSPIRISQHCLGLI